MAKENTFSPLHTGEASAETLQSLVNNTTNQDRDPYLSLKKKSKELNRSQNTPLYMHFLSQDISQNSVP